MPFSIKDHHLLKDGKAVPFRASPNHGGAIKPTLLVMHYTVSGGAKAAVDTLCNPDRKASAHLVLDRDGSVTQLVPFNIKAWHAGPSAWPRKTSGRQMCNGFSIGIEMVNWGWLHQRGDGKFASDGANVVVPPKDVIMSVHQDGIGGRIPWQTYTPEQLAAAEEIARAICAAYGIKEIVGHEEVCLPVARKRDPGPAFQVARFADRVFGRADRKVA